MSCDMNGLPFVSQSVWLTDCTAAAEDDGDDYVSSQTWKKDVRIWETLVAASLVRSIKSHKGGKGQ